MSAERCWEKAYAADGYAIEAYEPCTVVSIRLFQICIRYR